MLSNIEFVGVNTSYVLLNLLKHKLYTSGLHSENVPDTLL